jgi:hypothetical protein
MIRIEGIGYTSNKGLSRQDLGKDVIHVEVLKKLRFKFLSLPNNNQIKKLVKKLRLRLLPYDSSFLQSKTVLQIESLFPIRSDKK